MMKVAQGNFGPHIGLGLLRTTVLASLALGIALTLTLTPGSAAANGQDELVAPIDLEEGRTAPVLLEPPSVPEQPQVRTVVEPPIVLAETRDAPKLVQRQVQRNDVGITQTSAVLVGNNSKGDAGQTPVQQGPGPGVHHGQQYRRLQADQRGDRRQRNAGFGGELGSEHSVGRGFRTGQHRDRGPPD